VAENHASYRKQADKDHAEKMRHHAGKVSDRAQDEAMIKKAIDQHDDQLHGGKKTRLKFKGGGHVEGTEKKARLDRASGGRTKGNHKTVVNVVMPQSHDSAGAPPMMPPHPPMMPPPGPPGGGAPPPGGPGGAPPPMPPHPPMGPPVGAGVPMPHARGGRAKRASGGRAGYAWGGGMDSAPAMGQGAPQMGAQPMQPPMGQPMPPQAPAMGGQPMAPGMMGRKKGGRVPDLDGGAGGGMGRLEKLKAYGSVKGDLEDKSFTGDSEDRSAAKKAKS
jgi:hypothetical protein